MLKLLPAFVLIVFVSIAVSCGGGGDGSKVAVSAEGGAVMSDDGKLTLEIPPGALDEEVEITITAVSVDDLPEALREASGPGAAYQLEPDGLEFDELVPVTLVLNRSELDDVPEDGVVAYLLLTQDADGEIESLDDLTIEATLGEETIAVRGVLSHFSWLIRTEGGMEVGIEEVRREQIVGSLLTGGGDLIDASLTSYPDIALEDPILTFRAFGHVSLVGQARFQGPTNPAGQFQIRPGTTFKCSDEPGLGIYGVIGEATEVLRVEDAPELRTELRIILGIEVECMAARPTLTPTRTPDVLATVAGVFFATNTPEPPPTSTPAAKSKPGADEVRILLGCETGAEMKLVGRFEGGKEFAGTHVLLVITDPSGRTTGYGAGTQSGPKGAGSLPFQQLITEVGAYGISVNLDDIGVTFTGEHNLQCPSDLVEIAVVRLP